ncbi:MAG: hypothetical protein Q4C12_02930, partial [Clostridia bacterium]|nr:hypothetical protein [Clostridia bacterium]
MKRKSVFIFLIAAVILPAAYIGASASTASELSSYEMAVLLQQANNMEYNPPYSSANFPQETIDPASGSLTLTATDLTLPGKNGLDFSLRRIYNNQETCYPITKTSAWYDESSSRKVYTYYYIKNSHEIDVRIFFDDEATMISEGAYNTFKTTADKLSTRRKEDDYDVGYYKYSDIHVAYGEITLTRRHISPDQIDYTRNTYLHESVYDNRRLRMGMCWKWDLPVMYTEDYEFGSDEDYLYYTGTGVVRSLSGETFPIKREYEKNRATGEYETLDTQLYYDGGLYEDELVAPKTGILDPIKNVVYEYTLTDPEGRIVYYNPKGYVVAIEDGFGNYITFEYVDNFKKLSKVVDTMGRIISYTYSGDDCTVSIDTNGDNIAEQTVFYELICENNDSIDPTEHLSADNLYTFNVTIEESDNVSATTSYQFVARQAALSQDLSNVTVIVEDVYNIQNVSYPNGAESEYEYTIRQKYVNYVYNFYNLTRRKDISSGSVYNDYTYAYTNANSSEKNITTTKTRVSDGRIDKYISHSAAGAVTDITINDGESANRQSVKYTYPDDYELVGGKVKPTKEVQKSRGYTARTTNYTYNGGFRRLTSRTYDGRSEEYTYHEDSMFPATKIYNTDATHYVKEEYLLSEEDVSGDFFKNRYIKTKNVYESADGGVTYTLKETTEYERGAFGDITAVIQDPDGLEITTNTAYVYSGATLTATQTASGIVGGSAATVTTVTTTDGFGRTASVTDGRGSITQYSYDKMGRLTQMLTPDNTAQNFSYNTSARTTIFTDENGNQTKSEYDGLGSTRKVYKKISNVWKLIHEYEYDAIGRLTKTIKHNDSATRLITEYAYTKNDMLASATVKDQSGNVMSATSYAYAYAQKIGAAAELTAHDVSNGGTAYKFTAVTITQTARDGITPPSIVEYYNVDGLLCRRNTTVVEDGVSKTYKATYVYDLSGNLLEYKDERAYDENFNVDYSGKTEYDYANRVLKSYNAEGLYTVNTYDAIGRHVSSTDYEGSVTTYQYDDLGRMTQKSEPMSASVNSVTTYQYDANSNLTREQIYTGTSYITKYNYYDSLNRVTAASDGIYYTRYAYDANGNVTKSVSGASNYNLNIATLAPTSATYNVVTYTYDAFNRPLTVTDGIGTTTYTYDLAGNVLTKRDGKNQLTVNTYNALGKLLTSKVNNSDTITYAYNSYGDAVSASRGSLMSYYAYDNLRRIVQKTEGDAQINYSYDIAGNMKNVTFTYDGEELQNADYTYNALNQLTNVNDGYDNIDYTYTDNGRPLSSQNGTIESRYTYNSANMLTNLTNLRTYANGNTQTLSSFECTYRRDGNLTAVTDTRYG